jgi:hypothetical protein
MFEGSEDFLIDNILDDLPLSFSQNLDNPLTNNNNNNNITSHRRLSEEEYPEYIQLKKLKTMNNPVHLMNPTQTISTTTSPNVNLSPEIPKTKETIIPSNNTTVVPTEDLLEYCDNVVCSGMGACGHNMMKCIGVTRT